MAERFSAWQQRPDNPPACLIRAILNRIGDKWTMLTLIVLAERPRRFSELNRLVPVISKRMLAQTLRDLECNTLVQREVFQTKPPSVL